MLPAIDVGNTNIVLGVFDGDALLVTWRLVNTARADGRWSRPPGDAGLFDLEKIDPAKSTGIVMASVVPPLTPIMEGMTRRYVGCDALIVDSAKNAGMPILYKNPEEVGADRIANSIAGYERTAGPAACRSSSPTSGRRRRSTPCRRRASTSAA